MADERVLRKHSGPGMPVISLPMPKPARSSARRREKGNLRWSRKIGQIAKVYSTD